MTAEVVVPRDGRERPCPACGKGSFYWWDCDGMVRDGRIINANRVDVDCAGITEECPECGTELRPEGVA